MKKSFYNRCKCTIFYLLTLAFIFVSTTTFATGNNVEAMSAGQLSNNGSKAVIISNSGKVNRAQTGACSTNCFPDRTFVVGN